MPAQSCRVPSPPSFLPPLSMGSFLHQRGRQRFYMKSSLLKIKRLGRVLPPLSPPVSAGSFIIIVSNIFPVFFSPLLLYTEAEETCLCRGKSEADFLKCS